MFLTLRGKEGAPSRALVAMSVLPLVVALSGCVAPSASVDPGTQEALRSRTEQESAKARGFESNGDLQAALQSWWIVHAMGLERESAAREIESLEARIDNETREQVAKGERALERGRWRRAEAHLLSALALNPNDATAQDLLRKLETRRTLARLDEAPVPAEKAPTYSPPTEMTAAEQLERSRAVATSASDSVGHRHERSNGAKSPADQAYERGLALYRSDKSAAARAFRDALEHDPNHAKARAYLEVLNRLGVQ